MHSLLVAIDLANRSKHAFYRAIYLARQFHAQLTVLYVIKKVLPEAITRCLHINAKKIINDRFPGACAHLKPDLWGVNAHGTTGCFLLGSVATPLLHDPPTGMLVVRV